MLKTFCQVFVFFSILTSFLYLIGIGLPHLFSAKSDASLILGWVIVLFLFSVTVVFSFKKFGGKK